jgi:hypothetical protein
MADPVRYLVTVKRPFVIGESVFGPAFQKGPKKGFPRYRVTAEMYNGDLPDGTPFKDACITAEPEYARE